MMKLLHSTTFPLSPNLPHISFMCHIQMGMKVCSFVLVEVKEVQTAMLAAGSQNTYWNADHLPPS